MSVETRPGIKIFIHKPPSEDRAPSPLTRETFKRDLSDPIHKARGVQEAAFLKRVAAWEKTTSAHNRRLDERLLANLRVAGPVVVSQEHQGEPRPTGLAGFVALEQRGKK